jgi:predicted Zn finger-like uncharacterized protein
MIVSCPNCSTSFNVPESELGRMMRCARCGHIFKGTSAAPSARAYEPEPDLYSEPDPYASAPMPMSGEEMPGMAPAAAYSSFDDEIPMESAGAGGGARKADPDFGEMDGASDLAMAEIDSLGFTGEGGDSVEDDEDDPFARMSELMQARTPESMPDMFTPAKPKRPLPKRKGAFILWVVLLILFLAAAALGLYAFQDKLIDRWPGLAKYYEQIDARRDEVGAGLKFRNYNSERLMQDNNEVLIVRGVIVNDTEQKHDIPLLRLALYNGTALLQEKIISPPQAALDAKATVGFKVTLEQPDANATRFEVTFIAPKAGQ